jgi:glycosyltransferase involved in cell wall biosynthesis
VTQDRFLSRCQRTVRICDVIGAPAPLEGGGFTFTKAVVDAIKACSSRHEFIVWEELQQHYGKRRRIDVIKRAADSVGTERLIRSTARVVRSAHAVLASIQVLPLERFIYDNEIDLVWFLCLGYSPVSVPYLATVWDPQHRRRRFFAEVSTTAWTSEARELAYRSNLPRAAPIITGTKTGKDEIIAFFGISPENISVVPMPVAQAALSEDSGDRIDVRAKYRLSREFLFYPAQFWPHKNHINLLFALDLIKKDTCLSLDVVLTGNDKSNQKPRLQDYCGSRSVVASSHLFVLRADLYGLYGEAICLAFVSFFGPDDIPPLEALAIGCPVIATCVPGADKQLEDAAWLLDPGRSGRHHRVILSVHRVSDRGRTSRGARRSSLLPLRANFSDRRNLEDFESIVTRIYGRLRD